MSKPSLTDIQEEAKRYAANATPLDLKATRAWVMEAIEGAFLMGAAYRAAMMRQPCSWCDGSGKMPNRNICKYCRSTGVQET